MTREVILTLGLLLAAGLAARVAGQLLRVPEVLVLVAAGALDRPVRARRRRRPAAVAGRAARVHARRVGDPLPRWAEPVGRRAAPASGSASGCSRWRAWSLTTLIVGVAAKALFDLPWGQALLLGAVLSPTDPAILIPLFVGSRLRAKLAQTVVAESALNDPTAPCSP